MTLCDAHCAFPIKSGQSVSCYKLAACIYATTKIKMMHIVLKVVSQSHRFLVKYARETSNQVCVA